MNYVLDSSAVICFLRDEPGADAFEQLLIDAENKFILHAVNWVEIRYLEQRSQASSVNSLRQFIDQANVEVIGNFDFKYLDRVASLKAFRTPIALGDCFAVALAQVLDAILVTTDRGELEKIASTGECKILFLR